MKKTGGANNGILACISTDQNSVSYSDYLTERNAKERAYRFIMSNNLLGRFLEFSKNDCPDDLRGNRVSYVSFKIKEP